MAPELVEAIDAEAAPPEAPAAFDAGALEAVPSRPKPSATTSSRPSRGRRPATFTDVLWLSVLIGTAGLVMLVPAVLQSADGIAVSNRFGFAAFAGTAFGVAGVILSRFSAGTATNVVASVAIAFAAGAVHPELLRSVRNPRSQGS